MGQPSCPYQCRQINAAGPGSAVGPAPGLDADPVIKSPFCDHGCRNRVTRNCNSGFLCRLLMGCAKCGGRMLTKVGRRQPMLICSDCGHPISDIATTERRRLLLSSSLLMVGLVAVASLTLGITRLREASLERTPPTAVGPKAPAAAAR